MPRHGTPRAALVVGAVAVVGLLALALLASAGLAAATRPVSPEPAPRVAVSGASASFSERAGYAAWEAAETVGAAPAEAPQSVVVVFEPQNRTPIASAGPGPVPVARYARADGLTASAYAAAERYFESKGLTVTHAWPDRLAISLAGDPAALGRAFATRLLAGAYDGRAAVYPSVPPTLPAGLETEVAGVVGLSTGYVEFSYSLTPSGGAVGEANAAPDASTPILPGNARAMYNVSQLYNLTGASVFPRSEAIAVLLWGAGYAPSDVGTFYSDYFPSSLPAPTINAYPIDGAPAPSRSALTSSEPLDVEELTLDLEWSGSMAPGATLDAIYAPGPSVTNLSDAFEKALSLPNVTAISMSFGAPDASDGSLISAWKPLLSEAETRGITVLAATGDTGGDQNASCTGGPTPYYPSSDPSVLAIGGTAVTPSRNGLGMITGYSQSAWSGSGGGYSTVFRAPGWQLVGTAGTAIEAAGGGRGLPDVSGTAQDNFVYYDGKAQEADGTSFATPLWAGIVADVDAQLGHSLGFFTDRLYHLVANQSTDPAHDGLVDVTSGSNCIASAAAGWDPATGWGSPRADTLFEEISGSFVNLSVAESPTTVAPGGTVAVQAQVTNASTGRPIDGIPVVVSLSADTDVGPCTGTFGSVSLLSNTSGWVSASLGVPACYLGSHARALASVSADRLYGHRSADFAVNLLGLLPALEPLGRFPYDLLLYAAILGAAMAAGGWIGRRPPSAPVARGPPPAAAPPPPAVVAPRPPPAAPVPPSPAPPPG